ncbi:MAG: SGNH/GDSL hydrolase family protein [Micrococcales bacterium]|nr:SGNH/GDSL hydrolase family protein [Micrococcales bacterium]
MVPVGRPRRDLLAAAGFGVLVAVAVGIRVALRHQAAIARRRIGKPFGESAPEADRVWKPGLGGEPLLLLLLGDSVAAGLGTDHRKHTPGARLAKGLARGTRRPVRLHTAAIVGSESAALAAQLDALPAGYRPDLAVVMVGGNDVTHRIPVAESTAHLRAAIDRLRSLGAEVVVGTCPDLGALRAVPQPLRALGSRMSRQLADAQDSVARAAGAHVVSLRSTVGPMFLASPEEMFSIDRFHPSAVGYRRVADAILPVALAALAGPSAGAAPTSAGPSTPRRAS